MRVGTVKTLKKKKYLLNIALAGGVLAACTFVSPIVSNSGNVLAAYAEDGLSFFNDGYIVISGEIKTAAENEPIVMTVVRNNDSDLPLPDDAEVKYIAEGEAGKYGDWKFEFALEDSGNYKAYIGTAALSQNEVIEFTYTNKQRYETAVNCLFDENTDIETAAKNIEDYAVELGLGDVDVNDSKAVAELARGEKQDDAAELADIQYLLKKCNMITELNAGGLTSLKAYNDIFTSENVRYRAYVTDDVLDAMIPDISNKDYNSFEQFDTEAENVAIVSIANNGTNDNVKEMLKQYYAKLGINQSAVTDNMVKSVKAAKVTSVEKLKSFLASYKEPSTSGGGGGGGFSSGKGSGVFVVGSLQPHAVENKNDEKVYLFDDIEQVEWANEAITQLTYRGVINGKAERVFAPNDKITREEFTKIITLAFKMNLVNGDIKFEDVNEDHWAYSYIKTAKIAGVVNGISEMTFGIGSNITREDLCVMTDRMIKIANPEFANIQVLDTKFGDDSSISDYAKESVYRLAAAGIVSGDGTGFNPKGDATRAEAAKIVYLAMKTANE